MPSNRRAIVCSRNGRVTEGDWLDDIVEKAEARPACRHADRDIADESMCDVSAKTPHSGLIARVTY